LSYQYTNGANVVELGASNFFQNLDNQ
jgi:hypothetical protein